VATTPSAMLDSVADSMLRLLWNPETKAVAATEMATKDSSEAARFGPPTYQGSRSSTSNAPSATVESAVAENPPACP
jgi:hypothetical protein